MKDNQFKSFTALEYRFYKFFERVKNLTEFDNNDYPSIIWGEIKTEVDNLESELKGGFGL